MNLLKRIFVPLSIFYVLMFGSFANAHQAGQDDGKPHHPNRTVRLATTTSTYHSGLLNHLLPQFEVDTGLQVKILAAGTGKALKMGKQGDVDLVITHAPEAEAEFIEKQYGVQPKALMYNDFVLLGPKSDPAKLKKFPDILVAFEVLANENHPFVSRGDRSGTHIKEVSLWQASRGEPTFSEYKSVGQGMGPTLNIANELEAYTLADRGTWLAYQNRLDLIVMVQGDERLFNPYQVILVNPRRHPHNNYHGAKRLSDWLTSPKIQKAINQYRINGQTLFTAHLPENTTAHLE